MKKKLRKRRMIPNQLVYRGGGHVEADGLIIADSELARANGKEVPFYFECDQSKQLGTAALRWVKGKGLYADIRLDPDGVDMLTIEEYNKLRISTGVIGFSAKRLLKRERGRLCTGVVVSSIDCTTTPTDAMLKPIIWGPNDRA